jgi:hypothetical protein
MMGGPWKVRGAESLAWRPPPPRVTVQSQAEAMEASESAVMRIVIGYVAAVLISCAILLCLLKLGWLTDPTVPGLRGLFS